MLQAGQTNVLSSLMAHPATANHANNNYFFHSGNNFNFVFHFRETPPRHIQNLHESDHSHNVKMSSPQATYAFIVTVLLNLVQIKYQSEPKSPFETRPKTMFVAVASLLLYYCLSCYANLTRISFAYLDYISKISLGLCGPFSLASFISLLLPASVSPILFFLSVLFSLSQLIPKSYVETICDMVAKSATCFAEKFRSQPPHHAMRRRGRGGVQDQVQLPWFQFPYQRNAIANSIEMALPV